MIDQQKPRADFLGLAEQCGARITGKPDGSEPIEIIFSIEAWRQFDAALAPAQQAAPSGWISVNERLPEDGIPVLIFFPADPAEPYRIDMWDEDEHGPNAPDWAVWYDNNITHWMPLPPAPGAAPAQPVIQVQQASPSVGGGCTLQEHCRCVDYENDVREICANWMKGNTTPAPVQQAAPDRVIGFGEALFIEQAKVQQAAASNIPAWQERMSEVSLRYWEKKNNETPAEAAMQEEIYDLRAALAAAPAQPVGLSEQDKLVALLVQILELVRPCIDGPATSAKIDAAILAAKAGAA